jgi:hypothetical protein
VTRLPPIGYGLDVLRERSRAAREELSGEKLDTAAAGLGFVGLRFAEGTRVTRGTLEALSRSVKAQAAQRKARG